nr:hypothetical protein [Candidatus Sigynarchaeum springense]
MLKLAKASMSIRVGVANWLPAEQFDGLIALFEKYKGFVDGIALFTSETHPPLPLDVFEQRSKVLAARMVAIKGKGYRAGINVLSTLGHHEENLPHSLAGNYQHLVDPGGNACKGTICPNDERSKAYIKKIYELTAKAGPDYIWIDDDVRLAGHKPIAKSCFCDACMKVFADEYGLVLTRDDLAEQCMDIPPGSATTMRRRWLDHNRNTIANLLQLIERTVHSINPCIELGLMTGDRFYEGYAFARWADILAGPGKVAVMWRPGGGFYEETVPSDLFMKSHDIGRQVSVLPESVLQIQSEVENFPYQLYRKTPATTILEAAAHVGAGCTGAAYNLLSESDVGFFENELMIKRLQKARPFLDYMASTVGRSPPEGIYTGWNIDSQLAAGVGGDWFFGGIDNSFAGQFFQIGVPAAYSGDQSSVTLFSGNGIHAHAREGILGILSKGVYMDASAVQALAALGFGEYIGFKVGPLHSIDCSELLLADDLNDGFENIRRDARQSFYPYAAASLEPLSKRARALCRMIDYSGATVADCCMGVYENALGGRICVAGYYPWSFLLSRTKATQLKRVARWLSKDKLPGFIGSYHKINMWARKTITGEPAFVLANSSLMEADGVELYVKTRGTSIVFTGMDNEHVEIRAKGTDGGYTIFSLPQIGAMNAAIACVK